MIKSEAIQNLLARFESIACEYEGVECWSARELYPILDVYKRQIHKSKMNCLRYLFLKMVVEVTSEVFP